MAQEERLADMRKQFVEDVADWLASDVGIVGQVYLDKPGSRKHALKNPSDNLIGRALVFDPGVAKELKRMRLSYLREDSVVKSQNRDDFWEESLPADREAWQKAYEAILVWLHDQYGTSNPSPTG
jgi:hypothetical protein